MPHSILVMGIETALLWQSEFADEVKRKVVEENMPSTLAKLSLSKSKIPRLITLGSVKIGDEAEAKDWEGRERCF
ncbi:hypothetical protein RIF29_22116 [Crotalaria pallida]|uniref:Uncharacterized protein n=1 Tax=Crotalaria pallida TaxID=3830 RepID=A0AAN9F6J7_CROPI